MIRTIIWYIWFFLSLIISVPFTFRVKYLIKKNRIDESEALIYKCTTTWANSLLKIAGVKVNVHGVENIPKDKTVLFVGTIKVTLIFLYISLKFLKSLDLFQKLKLKKSL